MILTENNIPVTVVSGLARAGKTALINNMQSAMGNAGVGIIRLFENVVFANAAGSQLAGQNTLTCNTCYAGLQDEMEKLADKNIDYLLIENNSNCNPLWLVEGLSGNESTVGKAYRPHILVTVLDAFSFVSDYSGMDDERDSRIKDILNTQIEYANVIVLNKKDLVSTSHLNIIKAFERVSNEEAVLLESAFGKIPLVGIANTGLYATSRLATMRYSI